jgi:hypothetical protein
VLHVCSSKRAKGIISELDLDSGSVGILDLDTIDDGPAIQDYLEQKTSQLLPMRVYPECAGLLKRQCLLQSREPFQTFGSTRNISAVSLQ